MFITLEGMDGSGKTTQIDLLHQKLIAYGYDSVVTREPGGTSISEAVRKLLLSTENIQMEALTEALLYAAARAQHVREVIRPALEEGKIVLCDRFFDSSIAYQAFGRQLGIEAINAVNCMAMDGLVPDRTYLLMLDSKVARIRTGDRKFDRIEEESDDFFARVRKGYRWVSGQSRVMTIDAARPVQAIAEAIWQDLSSRLCL